MMSKADFDGWHCDTCGKLYVNGDALYAIADNEEAKTFRHWDCHTPLEKVFEDMRASLRKVEKTLNVVRHRITEDD